MGLARRLLLSVLAFACFTTDTFALDVLVVRPKTSDAALFEAFGRLRAELELQGFEVIVLPAAATPIETDALELAAQREGAFAAVALQREPDGTTAEVHIVDRVTGKTTTRKLRISKAKDGPLLLAIRAADLLRASLLELEPGQAPPQDVVGAESRPPPVQVVRFSRELPRFQITAGGLVVGHPDLGVLFGGSVAVSYRPIPRLSVGLQLGGPAFGGEFRVDENSASVREEFALFRVAYNLGSSDPGARFEWGPLAEIGVVHVSARGDVAPPLVARTSDVWTLGIAGGALVEAYLNETVSIGFDLKALGLVPQPVVAIGSERTIPLAIQGAASLRLGVSF